MGRVKAHLRAQERIVDASDMRFAEPTRSERARSPERRREAPPAPIDQILALQRSAGNRALARFLKVKPFDYQPTDGGYLSSHLVIADLHRKLNGGAFEGALDKPEKERLDKIDDANLEAIDIPTLATRVIEWLAVPKRRDKLKVHKAELENALAYAAPRETSGKEEGVFLQVKERFTKESRAKGVPNEVNLNQLAPEMRNGVNGLIAILQARNATLGQMATYTADVNVDPGQRATIGLTSVRSAHTNAAGWLPPQKVPPTLDTHALTWARGIASAPVPAPGPAPLPAPAPAVAAPAAAGPTPRDAIRAKFGNVPKDVTARAIETATDLPAVVKVRYYNEVLAVRLPNAAQRARHAWWQYADPQWQGCPFIEFTASEAGGISRYVWDYTNDRIYIGVHYNWVHGYNPFILVRGTQATL
jgi:hypothetical protein